MHRGLTRFALLLSLSTLSAISFAREPENFERALATYRSCLDNHRCLVRGSETEQDECKMTCSRQSGLDRALGTAEKEHNACRNITCSRDSIGYEDCVAELRRLKC